MQNIPIHAFLKDDASSIPFQLVQLTKEGSYDTSVPHRHNYYEIFFFEVGGGEHHVDFKTFPIQHKSVHFVSPGQVHQIVRTDQSKGYVVLFSREFYSANPQKLRSFPFLNNNSNKPILNLDETDFSKLEELVLKMHAEQEGEATFTKELIKAYLNAFLVLCKRFFNEDPEDHQKVETLSYRFKQLIEEHYLNTHDVASYAELLNSSERQLATATKKELGKSPKNLIDERIVLEAKRLVKHTDHSFQEIAFFLNFNDSSHFAKFFKTKVGCSPTEYRET